MGAWANMPSCGDSRALDDDTVTVFGVSAFSDDAITVSGLLDSGIAVRYIIAISTALERDMFFSAA